jgi:protein gp37
MSDTAIQWSDAVWNPVVGCSPVSEGCRNCYAAREAVRLAGNPNPKVSGPYKGTSEMRGAGAKRRAVFTGRVNTLWGRLDQPLRWRRPRRVFVNSMSDLFHEDVDFKFIAAVFGVMRHAHRHTFQVLTKRPERAVEWFRWMGSLVGTDSVSGRRLEMECDPVLGCEIQMGRHGVIAPSYDPRALPYRWPLPNVWIGTSVEDQAAADERIPHLLRTPAAVRFLSCEPLIGPVDLNRVIRLGYVPKRPGLLPGLHWIIAGGESGPGARPCDVAWIRSLVEQCRAAGVAAFVKQLGARPWAYGTTTKDGLRKIRDRKGGDPDEWPSDLRIREFPEVARG